jgi:glycosyltransferase involved in cell wall biosynthesis
VEIASNKFFSSFISSPKQSRSVTVVIPSLNEEENLQPLMTSLEDAFDVIGFTLPVLLVDDGSTDNSSNILKFLTEKYEFLRVIRHPRPRGVTGVWKTALANTDSDWLYWGQADLETDFRTDLLLLLDACKAGVDGVAGWRQQRGDGKATASSLANDACRICFGLKIHDMNWIKLVRRDLIAALPLDLTTHRFILPVLAGWGYNITEVPTLWHPRINGKSKFGRKRLLTSAFNFFQTWLWFNLKGRLQSDAYLEHIRAQS